MFLPPFQSLNVRKVRTMRIFSMMELFQSGRKPFVTKTTSEWPDNKGQQLELSNSGSNTYNGEKLNDCEEEVEEGKSPAKENSPDDIGSDCKWMGWVCPDVLES